MNFPKAMRSLRLIGGLRLIFINYYILAYSNLLLVKYCIGLHSSHSARTEQHLFPILPYQPCAERKPSCNFSSKYRTIDGSCNNIQNPEWGMVNTLHGRILKPSYADGISLPSTATDGTPLPLARKLTTSLFDDANSEDRAISLAGMQWGQFIAHDIMLTAGQDDPKINCCNKQGKENENVCFPIDIPPDDPFYSQFNVTCQNLMRHKFISSEDCSTNKTAQQINRVTHFVDGSVVYGSSSEVARSLREFKGGRLLVQSCNEGPSFLPTTQPTDPCNVTNSTRYLAGDIRVNQNPQLTILQTLFVREHNRIVSELQRLHSDWDDEKLYQEARSIVIAEIQHITYNEWLPLFLEKPYMVQYGLYSNSLGNYTYNSSLAPVTTVDFASIFRIGHSEVQGQINVVSACPMKTCPMKKFNFSDCLNLAGLIQQSTNLDDFLRGLLRQPMQEIDEFYTTQLTQLMFHGNRSYGRDLISTDIQRGRDDGLARYVEYLERYTKNRPRTFADLKNIIKTKYISTLEKNYKTVDDIDLFVGGSLEIPLTTSNLTFQSMLGEQFYRYKYGDRFWYEIREQPHSFTNGQLFEIKKVTLSRIVCDNSGIANVARNSFRYTLKENDTVPCDAIPLLNLSRW